MPRETLTGGCLCGDVRYTAHGEPSAKVVCHCATCRGASGAPMVAWFNLREDELQVTGHLTDYRTGKAVRRFCGRCGTHVLLDDSRDPGEIEVAAATLDDPDAVAPVKHTWVHSSPAWLKLGDRLPRYAQSSLGAEPQC